MKNILASIVSYTPNPMGIAKAFGSGDWRVSRFPLIKGSRQFLRAPSSTVAFIRDRGVRAGEGSFINHPSI